MELNVERLTEWSLLCDANLEKEIRLCTESWEKIFSFGNINVETRKALSELFGKRLADANFPLQKAIVCLARMLSRDPKNLSYVLTEPLTTHIINFAMNLNVKTDQDFSFEVFMEAEMCLVNALFNLPKAREMFVSGASCAALLQRIQLLNGLLPKDEAMGKMEQLMLCRSEAEQGLIAMLDLRLAFVITALSADVRADWVAAGYEEIFVKIVQNSLEHPEDLTNSTSEGIPDQGRDISYHAKRLTEALKTLFSFFSPMKRGQEEKAIYTDCILACKNIILLDDVSTSVEQDAVNLLTVVPQSLIRLIQEPHDGLEDTQAMDYRFLDAMLRTLDRRTPDETIVEADMLLSYFVVLIYLCTESKDARRYVRMKVVPPLHAEDVQQRPDDGRSLRNKMVRVMMSTTACREFAAEFMYILCKRSANRLMKYTGLGNAAGLLANYGCLGAINIPRRASDSEDSETEDYKEVESMVNPVTGYIEPPREDPLEGMTEEQKEHEIMRLVNAMSELMDRRVITPGTVDENGQVRPLRHVLELAEKSGIPQGSGDSKRAKDKDVDDSDSDVD